jgi:DNA repair exonuclease SbcCD ATPase subunit
MKTKPEVPEIVRAAEALEAQLTELESRSRAARKIELDSEKNIQRAARELNEALAAPEGLANGLRDLAQAMERMQGRQQAALEPLSEFASQIQARLARLEEHMQAFAELGQAASRLSALLKAGPEGGTALIRDANAQLSSIAQGAGSLFDAARADGFPEVAREAEALKQRVNALRKRLDQPN